MTSNQLTLGRLREDIRHNKVSENLGYATLGETKRHNTQSEAIGFGNIGLGYSQLGEARRHNIATENLSQSQLAELNRHNLATENYQSEQALSYASKADSDSAYTRLQIQHYLDELKVRQDSAEASLRNAATNEQRAKIEQQLADIKQEMVFWEKLRSGSAAFKDVATGVGQIVDSVGDVTSLIKPSRRSIGFGR